MRALTAIVVALCGCGRLGFGEPDARPDSVPPGFCTTATFTNAPASSVQDDFSAGVITDRWAPTPGSTTCLVQDNTNHELVASPTGAVNSFCHAYTKTMNHLTCDSIVMHVPEVTRQDNVTGVQTFIYIDGPGNPQLALLLEAGKFQMQGGVTDYVPGTDAWWRLSERDGELTLDTSPDGLAWAERIRAPTPFSLDNVKIALGAGTYKTIASPGQARFRCYNTPPPCN